MDNNGWIEIRERKPTKEDADACGCVLFWHMYNGLMLTGYFQTEHNRFLTHWKPTPEPPENYQEYRRIMEGIIQ